MFLASQYYRPPFPQQRFWADDFARMRDSGLHAVQLWVIWGWVESKPGEFDYHDYDQQIELADKKGLKVILSTIAEIHPFWIHRLVPDSHLVNRKGHKVVSVLRRECNVGLTPGGCFDHPEVSERMANFLRNTGRHFASASPLIGWDCWNETRWAVYAQDYVCYCPHTLREFRAWLDRRYGGLDGLNKAWQRRYADWQDVDPGRLTRNPYTEMLDFTRFLVARATAHARMRYQAIREGDSQHLISAHCGVPAIQSTGWPEEQALCRGNDWDLADQLDGYGCSHFPFWGEGFDEAGFGIRVESSRSANRGKEVWVSELQGGTARHSIMAQRSVPAGPQQRWVANGMARGAKGVIFWCWRDEVFGPESSGFGLDGWDGLARERLAAMKETSTFIGKNLKLIDAYQPDPAKVGVLFIEDNLLLDWAESEDKNRDASLGINGYALALERLRIPYEFVEGKHLDVLDKLDVLFMPWCLVLPEKTRAEILKFIHRGGRVVIEAETDAFDPTGFYRYPDERPFMQALGLHDLGRRQLKDTEEDKTLVVDLAGNEVELTLDNFTTPLKAPKNAEVLAVNAQGEPLVVRQKLGQGAVCVVGSFLGKPYHVHETEGFRVFLQHVCDEAGVKCDFELQVKEPADVPGPLQWRSGLAGKKRLLWIINGGPEREVTVWDHAGHWAKTANVEELVSGQTIRVQSDPEGKHGTVTVPEGAFAVLCW